MSEIIITLSDTTLFVLHAWAQPAVTARPLNVLSASRFRSLGGAEKRER